LRRQGRKRSLTGFATVCSESFPPNCRDPLKTSDDLSGRSVDPDLFFAHCLWPTALLVLHCNQLDTDNPNSHSTSQIRLACNVLLDRVFRLSATSLDSSILNPSTTIAYFIPAKMLLRLMAAAVEAGDLQTAVRLQAEVEVFRYLTPILPPGRQLLTTTLLTGFAEPLSPASETNCRSEVSLSKLSCGSCVSAADTSLLRYRQSGTATCSPASCRCSKSDS
jgi:hypothetical protein